MDLKRTIYERRTIRRFKDDPIKDEELKEIISAGIMAPSACNQQTYSIIHVKDKKIIDQLKNQANFRLINRIPTLVYVVCDDRYNSEHYANIQSVSATIQNMLLFAHSIGIGSWWIASCGLEEEVRKILRIPDHQIIISALGFGYSNEKPKVPARKLVDEMLYTDYFSKDSMLAVTNNPNNWSWENIKSFCERAIYAKSPDIGYRPLFKKEASSLTNYISSKLNERVLILFDDAGIYTFMFAKKNPKTKFLCLVSTSKIRDWLKERTKYFNLNNLNFTTSLDSQEFSSIICLDLYNRVPHSYRKHVFSLINKHLEKKGNAFVSFINRLSPYGLYIRKGISRRFGPEISLSPTSIKKLIPNNFKYSSTGFNLFPSLNILTYVGIPKKLKKYVFVINILSRFTLFEGVRSTVFRFFCNEYLLTLRKK